MQLHLRTHVTQDYLSVFNAFDEALFRRLSPPYPRLRLLRFDGSFPGDVVEVELLTGFRTFRWKSLITERKITDKEACFVDESVELPPPLRHWRHQHLVTKARSGAVIHDIIEYKTQNRMLDMLLYPLMLLQFGMRKPIYKRVFRRV